MAVLVGAIGGAAVGLTSVGSGTIMTVLLITFYQLETAQLVGTDMAHAALLTGTAALAHAAVGNVDFPLVGQFLMGSIPGVLLGSRLASKLPDRLLKSGLGLLLLGSAVKLFW
jgi:uncharacterized membrane protein YfcA